MTNQKKFYPSLIDRISLLEYSIDTQLWILEKNFFPAENGGNMPEIAIFADFVRTFPLFFVVFSLKNITNNNAHH